MARRNARDAVLVLDGDSSGRSRSFVRNLTEREFLIRMLPFALVALAGQCSAAWPPGPSNVSQFWVSTALVVTAAIFVLRPVAQLRLAILIATTLYVTSVVFLMLSSGGIGSGYGSLFFVAVVAAALYGRRLDSVVVVCAVIVALFLVSMLSPHGAASTARRMVLLGAIAAVLSVAIHALRERLVDSIEKSTRLLHQSETINDAARRLASLLEPIAIAVVGTELAVQMASPPGTGVNRARYLKVEGNLVTVVAQFGGTGESSEETLPLNRRPTLRRAVETLEPLKGPVDLGVGQFAEGQGSLGDGIWIPIGLDGRLHGVLEVTGLKGSIPLECFENCVALGHLMELALSNWVAHENLEQAGRAEERRRIARDLHDGLAHELAFIAAKARRSTNSDRELDAKELAGAADRALDEARRAITVLSATSPQSLSCALAQTAEDLGSRLGIPVLINLPVVVDVDVAGEVTEQLLRIVREAITNAATHAQPNCVTVSLNRDTSFTRVIVADDGSGFDQRKIAGSGGFGLISMRERAESIGASLTIESAPGLGTRIEAVLP
jgi:signal transduction histidine kinase